MSFDPGPIITGLATLGASCLTAYFSIRIGRHREREDNDRRRAEDLKRKDAVLAAQFQDIRRDQLGLRARITELEAKLHDCVQKHLRAEMEIGRLKALLK